MAMLLQNKNAIIYGAAGSLGGAFAKALADAGARVFLTARHTADIEPLATSIIALGGRAEIDQVDALNEKKVERHINGVMERAGSVDISFNATGEKVVQGIPLRDTTTADFMGPINFMLQSQFVTATAAAKVMIRQRSGVILSLTATPGGIGYPFTGGFGPACCALECFSKNLAAESGVYGVRVVNLRSAGSPDSLMFKNMIDSHPEIMEPILRKMKDDTMLKKLPFMKDIASVAVFLASDQASMITGVTVDVTSGTTSGLNYRVDPIAG